jgi:Rieske Fe-S protein
MAGRFLYPTGDTSVGWCFVTTVDRLKLGQAMPFKTPSGAKVVIARRSEGDGAESFVALSSVCPHLGCQVHWEAHNNRFFCPCHNGVFDSQGNPLEGPPAQANQQLMRFPLKVKDGLLFIEAPLKAVGQTVALNDGNQAEKSRAQEA